MMTEHSRKSGKLIGIHKWENESPSPADPNAQRDAVVGEKIVHILKEMLQSWRLPKPATGTK